MPSFIFLIPHLSAVTFQIWLLCRRRQNSKPKPKSQPSTDVTVLPTSALPNRVLHPIVPASSPWPISPGTTPSAPMPLPLPHYRTNGPQSCHSCLGFLKLKLLDTETHLMIRYSRQANPWKWARIRRSIRQGWKRWESITNKSYSTHPRHLSRILPDLNKDCFANDHLVMAGLPGVNAEGSSDDHPVIACTTDQIRYY